MGRNLLASAFAPTVIQRINGAMSDTTQTVTNTRHVQSGIRIESRNGRCQLTMQWQHFSSDTSAKATLLVNTKTAAAAQLTMIAALVGFLMLQYRAAIAIVLLPLPSLPGRPYRHARPAFLSSPRSSTDRPEPRPGTFHLPKVRPQMDNPSPDLLPGRQSQDQFFRCS
jgi:hypothetical protein